MAEIERSIESEPGVTGARSSVAYDAIRPHGPVSFMQTARTMLRQYPSRTVLS